MSFVSAVFVGLLLSAPVVAEPLIEGRVRLSSGAPAASAQVLLFDMTALERGPVAQATTDASGYFALSLASSSGPALPEGFGLGPNYPNPFNPSTIIPYQLPIAARVRLEVFNVLGQRVATLVNGERPAGFHSAVWDATNGSRQAVAAGVYIYRLTAAGAQHIGRMVLVDGQAGTAAVSAAGSAVGVPAEPAERTYGIVVSGAGVDAAFAVRAGMGPVEFVVDSTEPAGKATSDCSLADIMMNKDGCAENPILTEVPEGYTAPPDTTNGEGETPENEEDEQPETLLPEPPNECAENPTLTNEDEQSEPAPPGTNNGEGETPAPTDENDEQSEPVPPGATNGEVENPTLTDEDDDQTEPAPPGTNNECAERPILTDRNAPTEPAPPDTTNSEGERPVLTDRDDEQSEPAPPDTTNGRDERPILTDRDDAPTEPAPPDTTNGEAERPILTDRNAPTEPALPDTTNGRDENPIPTEDDDDQTEPAPPDTTGYDQQGG